MLLKSAVKCVTEYLGIKPVWPQKWSFKIGSGQIQNYLSAVPTDCCCFSDQMQQQLHESMEKRLFQIRLKKCNTSAKSVTPVQKV